MIAAVLLFFGAVLLGAVVSGLEKPASRADAPRLRYSVVDPIAPSRRCAAAMSVSSAQSGIDGPEWRNGPAMARRTALRVGALVLQSSPERKTMFDLSFRACLRVLRAGVAGGVGLAVAMLDAVSAAAFPVSRLALRRSPVAGCSVGPFSAVVRNRGSARPDARQRGVRDGCAA